MRYGTGLGLGRGFGRSVARRGPMAGRFHRMGLGRTAARVVGGMPLAFATVDRMPGGGLAMGRTPGRVDRMPRSMACAGGRMPMAFPAMNGGPGRALAVDRMPRRVAGPDRLVPMAFPAMNGMSAGVFGMDRMPGCRTGVASMVAVNGLVPVAVSAIGGMPGRVPAMESRVPGFGRIVVDTMPMSMAVAMPITMAMPAAVMAMVAGGMAVAMSGIMGVPSEAPVAAVMVGRRVEFGRVAVAFVGVGAAAALLVALPEPGAQVVDALLRAAAAVVIVFVFVIRLGDDQRRCVRGGGVGGLAPGQPSAQDEKVTGGGPCEFHDQYL